MLSANKIKWINKSILIRVAVSLTLLTVIIAGLFAAKTFLQIRSIHNDARQEINKLTHEVNTLYVEEGLDALLEEYELEEEPIFNNNDMLMRFDHDELVFALRNEHGTLITGAETLNFKEGWHRTQYRFEDEFIRVIGKGTRLPNNATLMLQLPLHLAPAQAKKELKSTIFLLLIFSFIMWPFLTIIISRFVNKEISRLTDEIDLIAEKPDQQRINETHNSTEFSQLATSLNAMLDQVAKLHRNMQTMSVGIAHDLKTPLSRVANRLQLMQQDIDDKPSLMTHIDKANLELQSIVTTFSNLIRLNEIESGRRKQGFTKQNFSQIVHELAESYQPVFEDKDKTLDVSIVDNVMCMGDRDLLSQLISNLLENALIYSEYGAKVWLRLQSNYSGALLQIGDSGPGIPKEIHSHVFERFYRADYSRGKPGNGLGLSIVKAICELHGANITLLPQQPGAVFDIVLPVQPQ